MKNSVLVTVYTKFGYASVDLNKYQDSASDSA